MKIKPSNDYMKGHTNGYSIGLSDGEESVLDELLTNWKTELQKLKEYFKKLADNLEIANGTRTCPLCGHAPEKMYEKIKQTIDQDAKLLKVIKAMPTDDKRRVSKAKVIKLIKAH